MILLRGTRFSQPIGAAEIDYGNPLSPGLIQAASGGATRYLCGNFSITSSKKTTTTYGLAESTALNQLLPATQNIRGTNSSFTLLNVELVSSSVAATASIYKLGNASNAARAWVSSANGTTAGAISASIYLGGNRALGGSFVKPVGSMYIGVLRHSHGVGASLFVDGAEDPVKALFTNTSLGHGYFGVRDAVTDGANALSVVWNRALSNAEIAEISSNPWQLFRPVQRRIYFDMGAAGGATTSVSTDLPAEYKIRSTVQSDGSGAYAIRAAVAADASSDYGIRGAISSDVSASYIARALAQVDIHSAYLVRVAVQADAASTFTVRDATQADAASTYIVRGAALADATAAYVLRGGAASDATAAYLLREAVLKELEASYLIQSATSVMADSVSTYHLRSVVSGDQPSAYQIRSLVSSDKSVVYSLRESALAQNVSEFMVRAAVSTALPTEYLIRASVYASDAPSYVIRGSVENDAYSTFAVREGIYRDLVAEYFIELGMSAVFADATSSYYLDGREVFFAKAQRYVDVPFVKVLAVVPVKRMESFAPHKSIIAVVPRGVE